MRYPKGSMFLRCVALLRGEARRGHRERRGEVHGQQPMPRMDGGAVGRTDGDKQIHGGVDRRTDFNFGTDGFADGRERPTEGGREGEAEREREGGAFAESCGSETANSCRRPIPPSPTKTMILILLLLSSSLLYYTNTMLYYITSYYIISYYVILYNPPPPEVMSRAPLGVGMFSAVWMCANKDRLWLLLVLVVVLV